MTDHEKEAYGVGQKLMSAMIKIRACL